MTAATGTDLLEAARNLAPLIESYRQESDRERSLPQDLVHALAHADLLRMYVPKSQGGLEVEPHICIQVLEALAKIDGAVAWNVFNWSLGGLFGARLSAPAAREVFASDPSVIISCSLAPKGHVQAVEGGYRLTGRWSLSSGCAHASWLVAGGTVMEGGKPRYREDGAPDVRLMFVPQSACDIIDTWDTTGLRGTGSQDFSLQEVFVSDERTFTFPDGSAYEDGPLYRGSIFDGLVGLIAGVALGISRAALDAFTELATRKVPTRTASLLGNRATVQAQLAQAEGLVRSARALLFETMAATWGPLSMGELLSENQSAVRMLAAVNAASSCAQAVDIVHRLGGSSSVYTTSRLHRCFQDLHVLTQHVGVSPWQWERVGRHFLGLGFADSVLGGTPGTLSGG
jgi:indole-3-acetate monooxygenase